LERANAFTAEVRAVRVLYVAPHFSCYIGWDQYFDGAAIWKDVMKRLFIAVGLTAFLMLIPLAVTSTHKMVRRLGGNACTAWSTPLPVAAYCATGG